MDLSKIEGLNLTEEQTAAITAQYNAETEGLRNKNEQLLGEKKNVQQSISEQAQALEDARKAAVTAEEERLKLAGDVEGLKSHYESQLAESTAAANEQAKKAQDALLSRDKGSALNKTLSLIHDDYKDLASAQLSNMLKVSYNDQGEVSTSYEHDGKVIANNVDEFKSWAAEQPAFKRILNGVDSSGADTSQSRGSASDGNTVQSKLAARLKGHGLNT